MSVNWQIVDLRLATGLDSRTDAKSLPATKLADLQNATLDNLGVLSKRHGYTELRNEDSSGTAISGNSALYTRGPELLLEASGRLYSYSDAAAHWIDRGALPSLEVTTDVIADSTSEQLHADMAANAGVTVYAWEDSRGGVYYACYDDTGASLIGPKQLRASATRPRCLAVDQSLLIIFADGSDLYTKVLQPADLPGSDSNPAVAFGFADLASGDHFDVVALPDASAAFFAYITTDASDNVRAGYLLSSGALGGPGSGLSVPHKATYNSYAASAHISVGINSDGSRVSAAYYTASGGGRSCINSYDASDLTSVTTGGFNLGLTSTASTLTYDADDNIAIFWQNSAVSASNYYIVHAVYNDVLSVVTAEHTLIRHAGLASSAFLRGNDVQLNVVHDSALQPSLLCIDSSANLVARALPGSAYGIYTKPHLPRVSGGYEFAAIYNVRLSSDESLGVYRQPGIKRVRYDFGSKHRHSAQEADRVIYRASGLLWQYDGEAVTESGFLLYPEGLSTATGTGGSLDRTKTYSYRVYWEWTNAQGQREQSSTAESLTVYPQGSGLGVVGETEFDAADNAVTLTIPTLSATAKTGVVLAIYRTLGDGTTYRRVSSLDPSAAGANGYVTNDKTVDTITFVDQMSDATLASKELDYQNTGERDNIAPPAGRGLAFAQGRLWLVSAEDRRRVYYSKLSKQNTAAEFHDGFYVEYPEPIIGVAEMGGHVLAFAEHDCFLVAGEGPNNLGFGDYSRVESLNNGIGLVDPASLLEIPAGLLLKGAKGIWLLTRQFSSVYIGSDVHAYNSQTIRSADLLPALNQVRMLSDTGRCLVYDYELGQWSSFTNHVGNAATVRGTVYCYCSDSAVHVEGDTYTDAGTAIPLSLTTAWIKPSGMQGFARLRRMLLLADYQSPHKLRIEVGYDYEPFFRESFEIDPSDFIASGTWGDSSTWGSDAVWGGDGRTGVYQAEKRIGRQKCEAVRFRITEIPGTGAGLRITGISLEMGRLRGTNKMSKNRRRG